MRQPSRPDDTEWPTKGAVLLALFDVALWQFGVPIWLIAVGSIVLALREVRVRLTIEAGRDQ